MSGYPVLFTERLILRVPEAADLPGFVEMGADEEAVRYTGGIGSPSQRWRVLCVLRGAWDIGGYSMFSVIERATGTWVGHVGPWEPAGWPGAEVGWSVLPRFQGKGYAYEAAAASIDYAFDVLRWNDVIHIIDPANERSIALARRLGSANRGPTRMPAPYGDKVVDAWGQTADQWRARRKER